MRCGDKWTPGHRCSATPQLHALQEVWALCQDAFELPEDEPQSEQDESAQAFLAISVAAMNGSSAPHTMQFSGFLADKKVLILVDSGSSHSFISSTLAATMAVMRKLAVPMLVRVADGGTITCDSELPQVEWSVQGHSFHSTFKVIPLGSFDIILGMDWLEAFSPMRVSWKDKWMSIPYGSGFRFLKGMASIDSDSSLLQLFSISSVESSTSVPPVPPPVQELLDEFSSLFAEPTTLPPRRNCDHSIPLVPGAQPVSIRQYRYSPKLKTEIETQVSELLQTGMIRPSSSPFSSPVLLVRKKDKS
jgi:hypothetical protein